MSDSHTRQVRKTITMLSSMIQSGESHSPESEKMVELSNKAMDGIEGRLNVKDSELIIMPRRLTAENGAKHALIGEFYEEVEVRSEDYCGCGDCDYCEMFPDDPEYVTQKVPVKWTTIKDIYKKVVELFDE